MADKSYMLQRPISYQIEYLRSTGRRAYCKFGIVRSMLWFDIQRWSKCGILAALSEKTAASVGVREYGIGTELKAWLLRRRMTEMQAERWRQIGVVFQSAQALKDSERAAFLERACADNKELQQEVESLLAAYEKTGSFVNVPAHQVAAQLIGSILKTEEHLSGPPTLLHQTDVARGDDTKVGSTGRRRVILVGLFFSLMCIGIGVNSYHSVSYFSSAGDPGWLVGLDGRVQIYRGVTSADVSMLRDGDEVITLEGRELTTVHHYFETFARLTPGSKYTMVVGRDGRTQRLELRTGPYHLWIQIPVVLLQLVLPATFLLIGLAIFLLRQDDKRALLLALMLAMIFFGGHPPFALLTTDLRWWLSAIMKAVLLAAGSLTPVMLHFFLIFPERSPLLVRFARLEFYIYPLYFLTAYPFFVIAVLRLAAAPERFLGSSQEFPWYLAILVAVGSIYFFGALLSLVVNYRKVNRMSRRKLRLVFVGTMAAFIPGSICRVLIFILKPSLSSLSPLWLAVISAGLITVLLFPLSFAYAIVRHQIIPVSLIIRRSVQYLLAKNGLRIILALPSSAS
jgi:hypothetical protein